MTDKPIELMIEQKGTMPKITDRHSGRELKNVKSVELIYNGDSEYPIVHIELICNKSLVWLM